jgi:hypothetical protein
MIKEGSDMKKWRQRSNPGKTTLPDQDVRNLKRRVHPVEADLRKSKETDIWPRAQACSRGSSRSHKVHQRGVKNLPMFRHRGVKTKMKSSVTQVFSDHLEFSDQYHFSL